MGGRPKSREVTGVRLTSFLNPPTPVTDPLWDQPAHGGGGQLLSLLRGGGPSQLFSLFRGGGEGETGWPPSASIPPQLARGPVSPRHPQEAFGEGAQGPGERGR